MMDMGMMGGMGNQQNLLQNLMMAQQQQQPQISDLLSHPEVHQGIAEGVMSQAKNYGKELLKSLLGGTAMNQIGGMTTGGGGRPPGPPGGPGGGGPGGPPQKRQQASDNQQQQAPIQQPQMQQQGVGGVNQQNMMALQQLLQQATGVQQPQGGYQKPGWGDYMAKTFGGFNTPNMTAATAAAEGYGALGPNVSQTYMTGQLPLTTAQRAEVGIGKYKAKNEAMNNYLERLNAQEQEISKQLEQEAKQFRGPLEKFRGQETPMTKLLHMKLAQIRTEKTDVQQRLAGVSKPAKEVSKDQEAYRQTASGNKFRRA